MPRTEFVDSVEDLRILLHGLTRSERDIPDLFCDLEGNNLGRHGTISLLTLFDYPNDRVSLIDVTKLGSAAFDTAIPDGTSLQTILESGSIFKAFFDVRCDSNALHGLYGINVAGIWDIQLMELASRLGPRRHVNGLARCIETDAVMGIEQKKNWTNVKEAGRRLFDPQQGGSYAVFDQRPLSTSMQAYSVQDVTYLPQLWKLYASRLRRGWVDEIMKETESRLQWSRGLVFNGGDKNNAKAPPHWHSLNPKAGTRDWKLEEPVSASKGSPRMEPQRILTRDAEGDDADIMVIGSMLSSALDLHADSDFEEDDEPVAEIDRYTGYGWDSDRDQLDFTACSAEDCGYCGHCDY